MTDERRDRISAESYRVAALSAMTEEDMRDQHPRRGWDTAAGSGITRAIQPASPPRAGRMTFWCRHGTALVLGAQAAGEEPHGKAQQEWLIELTTSAGGARDR